MVDSKGIISPDRKDLNTEKKQLLTFTNPNNQSGTLIHAMHGADIFIGVSAPNILTPQMIHSMADKPIVIAMANPIPEIDPALAKKSGAYIVGTGRSDYPNQINNVLAFPGVFRGALDNHVSNITDKMKLRAANAIAGYVKKSELSCEHILPSALDRGIVKIVARAIK
jgi:malate dehydrogenase (oxaloacetate-decarboxylating)